MKNTLLLSALIALSTAFAMPLKWTCNFPEASAVTFSVYQGETVTFEPTFRVNGVITPLEIENIYYQTNGMAEAWWKLDGNTFHPSNDVGSTVYRFFVQAAGDGGKNYRANGTLRMLPSPGFIPNSITTPKVVFDFSNIVCVNEPWPTSSRLDEAVKISQDASQTAKSLESFVFGDDCQLVSTNYDSKVHLPNLFLRFKIKDEATGEMVWYKVWDELTRWNYLFDTYLPTNYVSKSEVREELDQKADRAWGFYDSHSGAYAPEGYTWISSPKIAIAGGLAYQRVTTSEGGIFVLCSNGLNTELGNNPMSTNGFFRITDDKGNAVFEISKGTQTLAGASASSLTTENVMGITHLHITYNVESAEHPKLEICRTLKASEQPEWKEEGASDCPANVTWSGQSGAWVAEVWGKQAEPSLFVKGTYKKGAKDIITNHAPVAFTKIVIGGVEYTAKAETMNGKKVLVLE